jgi:hypothetical protein
VKNHNSKVEAFILNISDITVNSKGEDEYVESGSMKNSIADWISIAPSFFELQPNEEKKIAVTMQQPADEYGSKWGVVFVRTAIEQSAYSADKTISAGINITGRIAVNLFQTPGTNKNYKANITNLIELTNEGDSIRSFSALINNLGDIITPSKVVLIATNVESADEIICAKYEFTMFPKSSRKINLTISNNLPKGSYSLAAILDYGSRTNLEGTQIIIKVE